MASVETVKRVEIKIEGSDTSSAPELRISLRKVCSTYTKHPNRVIRLTSGRPSVIVSRSSNDPKKLLTPAERNVIFDSPIMSREHAKITYIPASKEVNIEDLSSTHGTYVDGRKLTSGRRYPIIGGESITFGTRVMNGSLMHAPLKFYMTHRLVPKPSEPTIVQPLPFDSVRLPKDAESSEAAESEVEVGVASDDRSDSVPVVPTKSRTFSVPSSSYEDSDESDEHKLGPFDPPYNYDDFSWASPSTTPESKHPDPVQDAKSTQSDYLQQVLLDKQVVTPPLADLHDALLQEGMLTQRPDVKEASKGEASEGPASSEPRRDFGVHKVTLLQDIELDRSQDGIEASHTISKLGEEDSRDEHGTTTAKRTTIPGIESTLTQDQGLSTQVPGHSQTPQHSEPTNADFSSVQIISTKDASDPKKFSRINISSLINESQPINRPLKRKAAELVEMYDEIYQIDGLSKLKLPQSHLLAPRNQSKRLEEDLLHDAQPRQVETPVPITLATQEETTITTLAGPSSTALNYPDEELEQRPQKRIKTKKSRIAGVAKFMSGVCVGVVGVLATIIATAPADVREEAFREATGQTGN